MLKRELYKPFDHQVLEEDESVVRALHAQAGLLVHVRAQAQQGARASLRRRELGELFSAIYQGLGYEGDERRTKVERLLRFSAERLVLLIHDVQGEYSFGVRSLQEFFAAEALMEGDMAVVAARLKRGAAHVALEQCGGLRGQPARPRDHTEWADDRRSGSRPNVAQRSTAAREASRHGAVCSAPISRSRCCARSNPTRARG